MLFNRRTLSAGRDLSGLQTSNGTYQLVAIEAFFQVAGAGLFFTRGGSAATAPGGSLVTSVTWLPIVCSCPASAIGSTEAYSETVSSGRVAAR